MHQGCDSPSESQHITMTVDTSAMVASRVHFMEVLAKFCHVSWLVDGIHTNGGLMTCLT